MLRLVEQYTKGERPMRAAVYLRVSTDRQECANQEPDLLTGIWPHEAGRSPSGIPIPPSVELENAGPHWMRLCRMLDDAGLMCWLSGASIVSAGTYDILCCCWTNCMP